MRRTSALAIVHAIDVSIHAPGRGATVWTFVQVVAKVSFNSRTREGCDAVCFLCVQVKHCFNSRTREGCDTDIFIPDALDYEFQFTHPGGVRRVGVGYLLYGLRVSIHAPGRGATDYR